MELQREGSAPVACAAGLFINRPGVAGAVLRSPSSFIHSFIHSLIKSVILFLLSFKILFQPNHKSEKDEIVRECLPPNHLSHVTCHVSGVRCHISGVKCHVSCVTFFFLLWGASRWRVCYQQGLPCL